MGSKRNGASTQDPLWFKDAVIYQLHVRSFCDSTADGIGDFRGLAQKLDYIRDLGVTAIWLLPFYPSPLRDDGYDIADYTNVNPAYGTLADFKFFLREAHERGLRVITELVVNHTSDQHPWFQRARRSPPGSAARNFYVWSDAPDRYKDARIIFKDFETSNWTWDATANAYYWHRFYSHQPDLNFDNPQVRRALIRVMDFWFGLGVDGFRLDAVPYLHEREGTTCENLPETHAELKALRAHVDAKYGDRMLLAEANQWPEDAAAYFGGGDECHMAFHFPLMPRMFMALRMEDRYPIIDILKQTPAIPENCQWAVFLRNHDELTLEMVTDEERDYMYRMYAKDPQARINLGIRRRLAPLLGNDRRRIELMNGLLLSLPGTPVLYYGDEIGMGDNIYLGDRNGVRTPMQWSSDRNAGFSRANTQKLFLPVIIDPVFSYEALNVEAQQDNLHSLLWWMRRLIALRRRFKAISRGSFEFLYPSNRKILAFMRRYEDQQLLVIANLSRFTQYAELDLSSVRGMVPVEAFGHTRFPAIGDAPYFLTLAPHSFHWFVLERPRAAFDSIRVSERAPLPTFHVDERWQSWFEPERKASAEEFLVRHLVTRRWFGGKSRHLKSTEIVDVLPIADEPDSPCILLVRAEYSEGDPETYLLTAAYATGPAAEQVERATPDAVFVRLVVGNEQGIVYGGVHAREFSLELLDAIGRRRRIEGRAGELLGVPTKAFRALRGNGEALEPRVMGVDQSNTSILFEQRLILKLFRRLEEGLNPDVEIGMFLSEEMEFEHTVRVAGYLEYRVPEGEPITLGVLQAYVRNEGDAWQFTLDQVSQYFERALALSETGTEPPAATQTLLELSQGAIPRFSHDLVGPYLEAARLLGQRTAEMHLCLASPAAALDPRFAPEPFTLFYQRALQQSFRNLTERTFENLARQLGNLPPPLAAQAERVLALKPRIADIFRFIVSRNIGALRTRFHGDYHLGQALWTGRDFVIIDFEGEPARPISARRIKRSPLRDTASMIRSFDYAVHRGLRNLANKGVQSPEVLTRLERFAEHWFQWSSSAFLRAYLRTAGEAAFLPKTREEFSGMLDVFLLEKAIYELGYELDHRPDWLSLPLGGIEWLVARSAAR
ncbi:MAG TPA: maltose alpha-D-glucosyltransferase [Polyangiaceae bacterium]|nr:maltose alpha-D-glucosyltransferase [Polyangiaceae bacterium]